MLATSYRPCGANTAHPTVPPRRATRAQELEGTGVTANVLVPGGATLTNMTAGNTAYDRERLIKPDVMHAPVVWLSSEASHDCTGRRTIGYYWDESLPIEERLAKASWPAAWPPLGRQALHPHEAPSAVRLSRLQLTPGKAE